MKVSRILIRSCLVFIGIWFTLCVVVGILATEMALHPGRRALSPKMVADAQVVANRNHAELEEVSITAADGATLRGWSIRPLHGKADAVILLHGHTDNRVGM